MEEEYVEEYAEEWEAVEEIRKCMVLAVDRFRSEAKKCFGDVYLLNEVLELLNPHSLLQSDIIEIP